MGTKYEQTGRVASIKLEGYKGGGDPLLLRSMVGVDKVSQPFNYVVEMLCNPGVTIDYSKIIGFPLRIELDNPVAGSKRYFHGYVADLHYGSPTDYGLDVYQALVVPWFWFLKKSSNCRIFRSKTIQQILTAVFKSANSEFEGKFEFDLSSDYKECKFEHVVQYNETDFAFASRLMEEHGIYYYFKYAGEKHGHKMVLIDAKGSQKDNPKAKKLTFTKHQVASPEAEVFRWEHRHQLVSDAFLQTDFNFAGGDGKFLIKFEAKGADKQGASFTKGSFSNHCYEAKFEEGVSKMHKQKAEKRTWTKVGIWPHVQELFWEEQIRGQGD